MPDLMTPGEHRHSSAVVCFFFLSLFFFCFVFCLSDGCLAAFQLSSHNISFILSSTLYSSTLLLIWLSSLTSVHNLKWKIM